MTSTNNVQSILAVVSNAFRSNNGDIAKVKADVAKSEEVKELVTPKTNAVSLAHKGIAFIGEAPKRDVEQCAPGQKVFGIYEPMVNEVWTCAWNEAPNNRAHYANHLYTLKGYRPTPEGEIPEHKLGAWYLGDVTSEMTAETARELAKIQRLACAPLLAAQAAKGSKKNHYVKVAAPSSSRPTPKQATATIPAKPAPKGRTPLKKVAAPGGQTTTENPIPAVDQPAKKAPKKAAPAPKQAAVQTTPQDELDAAAAEMLGMTMAQFKASKLSK